MKAVTIGRFFEAAQEKLHLEIEAGGEFLDRLIPEEAINRPGLALAGFFQYFANRRIQVLGLAELAYLKNLDADAQLKCMEEICRHNVPCIVLSRNRKALPSIIKAAEKYKIPLMRSSLITSRFVNEATLIMEDLVSPELRYQGTMVDIMGVGVIIEGGAGIGKSETALSLIERGYSLISDDITLLRRRGGQLIGQALDITRYHMEIRGLGIIHVPSLFGVSSMRMNMRLDLIIRLHAWDPSHDDDRTGLLEGHVEILGMPVPYITLPVAPGRDIAHVIEVAARNQKLKRLGHDAAKELDESLMERLLR